MAYDVVKTIKGHPYRYRVESYRDAQTGKVRNRWTYVGRVDGPSTDSPPSHASATQTRERIVEAFLSVIREMPWDRIGPRVIASKAGVALTTFYRHFRNRTELLRVCGERANQELDGKLKELHDISADARGERERLLQWAADLIRHPPGPPMLFRAWAAGGYEQIKEERHEMRVRAFSAYLTALSERGYIQRPSDIHRLAVALSIIVQLFTRRSVLEEAFLSEEEFGAVTETFDRLVFR